MYSNKYIKFNNKSLIYKNWIDSNLLYVNDITDENGRVSQDYLIEKLKNKIIFFSEFSRLKKAIPKEWYVQLSEEKSVKTTINIKKSFLISLSNSLVIPFHFRQLCRSHTTGCYQSSFYKLNFYY
jgi:predicted ATPase